MQGPVTQGVYNAFAGLATHLFVKIHKKFLFLIRKFTFKKGVWKGNAT